MEPRRSCYPTRAADPGSSTPPEFQAEIADEYLEDVSLDWDHPADIIGFSLMPPKSPRAHRIGDKF